MPTVMGIKRDSASCERKLLDWLSVQLQPFASLRPPGPHDARLVHFVDVAFVRSGANVADPQI